MLNGTSHSDLCCLLYFPCRGSPLRRRRSWGFVTPSFLWAVLLRWTLGKSWQSTTVKTSNKPPEFESNTSCHKAPVANIWVLKCVSFPSCSVWDHPGILGEGQLAGGLLHCPPSKERSSSRRPEWNSRSGKRGPRIWLWPRNSRARWEEILELNWNGQMQTKFRHLKTG